MSNNILLHLAPSGKLLSRALLALLVVACMGCTQEAHPTYATQKAKLDAIDPFVRIRNDAVEVNGDMRPQIEIDVAGAREVGVPEPTINFAAQLAERTNVVLSSNNILAVGGLEADQELHEFFDAFYQHEHGGTDEADRAAGANKQALHCGGDQAHPARCESWGSATTTYPMKQAAVNALIAAGYHQTAGYASDYNASDYTRALNNAPCGTAVYRYQAIVVPSGSQWTYRKQHDLNPEVLSWPLVANWPHWWWPTYVRWWHGQC